MLIDKELVQKAKEMLGDKNASLMAKELKLEQYDEKNKKALCCFHDEKTPSLIYNPKNHTFHCFSCQKTIDLIGCYMENGMSYIESVQKLFQEAGIETSFGEHKVKTKYQYKYPKEEPNTELGEVLTYMQSRGLSEKTLKHFDVRSDNKGNAVFNFYDTNDVLTMVKYRPAHKLRKGETKTWCQQNSDTCDLLYGMNLVDPDLPIVITEGECLTGDTEVLTPNGWIRLDSYNNQKVLQISEQGEGTFVFPFRYIKKNYNGIMLVSSNKRNYSAVMTPGHNFVYVKNGKYIKKKASDMPKNIGNKSYVPTTTIINGKGIPLTNDQLALYIMISVDASIDRREKWNYCRYTVKKERKYLRAKALLNRLGIPYTDTPSVGGGDYKYLGFRTPSWVQNKIFPMEWIEQATVEQRNFILTELIYHDGNRVPNRHQIEYSSKLIENATFVQTLAHTCGYMSTIIPRHSDLGSWYKVSVLFGKHGVSFEKGFSSSYQYTGKVYCVTVPTGMILIRNNKHISVIGNCDAMSIYEAGYTNVVSVPLGAGNTHWIQNNWDWLEQFKTIIMCSDNDEPGVKLQKDAVNRLGSWRCKYVQFPHTFRDELTDTNIPIKDANDVLCTMGKDALLQFVLNAKDTPISGVVDFADIKDIDTDKLDGIYTGLKAIDQKLMKLFFGNLTIVTGISGAGKSTFLNQLIGQSLNQGYDAFLYSGELPNHQAKNWLLYQLAGRYNLESRTNREGEVFYVVKTPVKKQISEFYRNRLFIYDEAEDKTADSIISKMEDLARKYGTKLFIIDNLTALDLKANENNQFEKQTDFINKLITFSVKYNVLTVLVVHPHKIEAMRRLTKMDIKGSMSMTDLAHRVISLYRITKRDRQLVTTRNPDYDLYKYDIIVDVLKDRMCGYEGYSCGYWYDKDSRRFYSNRQELDFQYKWDKEEHEPLPLPDKDVDNIVSDTSQNNENK